MWKPAKYTCCMLAYTVSGMYMYTHANIKLKSENDMQNVHSVQSMEFNIHVHCVIVRNLQNTCTCSYQWELASMPTLLYEWYARCTCNSIRLLNTCTCNTFTPAWSTHAFSVSEQLQQDSSVLVCFLAVLLTFHTTTVVISTTIHPSAAGVAATRAHKKRRRNECN